MAALPSGGVPYSQGYAMFENPFSLAATPDASAIFSGLSIPHQFSTLSASALSSGAEGHDGGSAAAQLQENPIIERARSLAPSPEPSANSSSLCTFDSSALSRGGESHAGGSAAAAGADAGADAERSTDENASLYGGAIPISDRPPSPTNLAAVIDGASRTLGMDQEASTPKCSKRGANYAPPCLLQQRFLDFINQRFEELLREPDEENEARLAKRKAEHDKKKHQRQLFRDIVGAYMIKYEEPDPISLDDDDLARHRKKNAEFVGEDLHGRRDWDLLDFKLLVKLLAKEIETFEKDEHKWVRDMRQRIEKLLGLDTEGILAVEEKDDTKNEEKAERAQSMLRRFVGKKKDGDGDRDPAEDRDHSGDDDDDDDDFNGEGGRTVKKPRPKRKGPGKLPEQRKESEKLPKRKKNKPEKQPKKANGAKLSAGESRGVLGSNGWVEPKYGSAPQQANTADEIAGSSFRAPPPPSTTTLQPPKGNGRPPKNCKAAESVAGPAGQQGNTAAAVAPGPSDAELLQPPLARRRGRPRKVPGEPKSAYNFKKREAKDSDSPGQEENGAPAKKKAKELGAYQTPEINAALDTVLFSRLSHTSAQHQLSAYYKGGHHYVRTETMPLLVPGPPATSTGFQELGQAQDQGWANNQGGQPITQGGFVPSPANRVVVNTLTLPRSVFSAQLQNPVNYSGAFRNAASDPCLPYFEDDKLV